MSNTVFRYEYCDGTGCKRDNRVVLWGELAFEQIKPYLDEGEFFIPGLVGLEDLQHRFTFRSPADHPWHRVHEGDLNPTDEAPTSEVTTQELLEAFRSVTWDVCYAWAE